MTVETTYTCDRCSATVKAEHVGWREFFITGREEDVHTDYDLCDTCAAGFDRWMMTLINARPPINVPPAV